MDVDVGTLYSFGASLVLAGMVVILAAFILLLIINIREKGKVKGGAALIIGPFPIIFGTDKESVKIVLLLSLALTVLLILAIVMFHFMFR